MHQISSEDSVSVTQKFIVSNLILIARSQQTSDVSLSEEMSAPGAPTLFSELHKLSNVFNNFHSPLTAIRALPGSSGAVGETIITMDWNFKLPRKYLGLPPTPGN